MRRFLLTLSLMVAAIAACVSASAATFYYTNPDNWAAVSAHFFIEGGGSTTWPGVAMTKVSDGWYSVTIPTGYENAKVVVNNNNNGSQYPATGGVALPGGDALLAGTLMVKYESEAFKVYYDNSYTNWSNVYIHYWGKEGATWNSNPAMTKVAGTNMYEFTVPAGTAGVLFRNGNTDGAAQSSDMAAAKNHMYSNTKDLGEYVPVSADPFTVYFDNFGTGWTTPWVYYWGGSSTTDYPGVAMTEVTGKPGYYQYQVPAGTKNVLFSKGGTGEQADATKTADYKAVADHIYTNSLAENSTGYEYASYVRNVGTPDALYILTNDGLNPMNPSKGTAMTKNGNTFTVSNVVIGVSEAGGDHGYFTFATRTGANWDALNAGDRFGAKTEGATLTDGKGEVVKYTAGVNASSAKSWFIAPGTYSFTVDFEAMEVTVSGTALTAGKGTINVAGIELKAGTDGVLEFALDTEDDIVGLQLDINLPSALLASQPVKAAALVDHDIQGNTVNGKYRVILKSNTNKVLPVKKGVLFTLPVSAPITAAPGEYSIEVTDIVLSDKNLLKAELEAGTIGKITVTEPDEDVVIKFEGNIEEIALQRGETATLTVLDAENNAITEGILWSSTDTNVATVSNGVVAAVGNGSAVVSATVGGAKVSVNVTVGKKSQTITWTQVFEEVYEIGEEITLTGATATSGLDVEFAITNGTGYATLENGVLTTTGAGVVTLQARQSGNEEWAPANPVTKTITIWLGYYPGDVNGDNVYTVADATATVNHILNKTPDGFNAAAADVNKDGSVDIVDVTLIIDLAMKADAASNHSGAPKRHGVGQETAESFSMTSNKYNLDITFTNMRNYTATQFDLVLPEGVVVKDAFIGGSDHKVAFSNNNGYSRVIAYSEDNELFYENGTIGVVLSAPVERGVVLTNALVDRVEGNNVVETSARGTELGTTTVIDAFEVATGEVEYYNLQGLRVVEPKEGLYIKVVNGVSEKVLVK